MRRLLERSWYVISLDLVGWLSAEANVLMFDSIFIFRAVLYGVLCRD